MMVTTCQARGLCVVKSFFVASVGRVGARAVEAQLDENAFVIRRVFSGFLNLFHAIGSAAVAHCHTTGDELSDLEFENPRSIEVHVLVFFAIQNISSRSVASIKMSTM